MRWVQEGKPESAEARGGWSEEAEHTGRKTKGAGGIRSARSMARGQDRSGARVAGGGSPRRHEIPQVRTEYDRTHSKDGRKGRRGKTAPWGGSADQRGGAKRKLAADQRDGRWRRGERM